MDSSALVVARLRGPRALSVGARACQQEARHAGASGPDRPRARSPEHSRPARTLYALAVHARAPFLGAGSRCLLGAGSCLHAGAPRERATRNLRHARKFFASEDVHVRCVRYSLESSRTRRLRRKDANAVSAGTTRAAHDRVMFLIEIGWSDSSGSIAVDAKPGRPIPIVVRRFTSPASSGRARARWTSRSAPSGFIPWGCLPRVHARSLSRRWCSPCTGRMRTDASQRARQGRIS